MSCSFPWMKREGKSKNKINEVPSFLYHAIIVCLLLKWLLFKSHKPTLNSEMNSTWIARLHHTPRQGSWLVYFIFLLFTQLSFVVSLCQQLYLILSLPWNALMSPMVQCTPSHCPPIDCGAVSLSVSRSLCITHHSVSLPSFPQEIEDVNMISYVIAHLHPLTFLHVCTFYEFIPV